MLASSNRWNRAGYVLPLMSMHPPVILKSMSIDEVAILEQRYQKAIEKKTTTVNLGLKLIAEMCGIDKVLTSHVARHTFAYLTSISGVVQARDTQLMLEHSDIETTMGYINQLNNSDRIDDAADKFYSWLKK